MVSSGTDEEVEKIRPSAAKIEHGQTGRFRQLCQRVKALLLRPPACPQQRAKVRAVALDRAGVGLKVCGLFRGAHQPHLTPAAGGGNASNCS